MGWKPMPKETRSVSIDEENDEWLDEQDNASTLVNELVTQARRSGGVDTAALDLQIQQKEREARLAEERAENLWNDAEQLRALKQEAERQEAADISEAVEALKGAPLDEDNPAVVNWAGNLGMTPAELVERLEEER